MIFVALAGFTAVHHNDLTLLEYLLASQKWFVSDNSVVLVKADLTMKAKQTDLKSSKFEPVRNKMQSHSLIVFMCGWWYC